jgi:uncharacterized protein
MDVREPAQRLGAPRESRPDGRTSTGGRLAALVGRLAVASAAHARTVLAASWMLAIVAASLAARLPVQGDFSRLLPPHAPAVVELSALERRTRVLADYMVGVEADDPTVRAGAASALGVRLARIDPDLVAGITADRSVLYQYAWSHRHLFASLPELTLARDMLEREMQRGNPLALDLDDGEHPSEEAFAGLEQKMESARKGANDRGAFVSQDGRLQLFVVRTTFTSDDTAHGAKLTALLTELGRETQREFPGVHVGMTGDVITSNAEHHALLTGMVASTIITGVLVLAALLLFYRSVLAVGALSWSLAVGVLVTFAFARLTVGHLNLASAFLSSIVIGNGINFGLVLLARYFEELREPRPLSEVIRAAASGSAPGTLTAAVAASAAYGSLAVTSFRGFRDFGIIGAAGMVLCWASAYTILPAGLALLGRPRVVPHAGRFGEWMARIVPSHPRLLAGIGLALSAVTIFAAYRYVTHDPFEDDLRNLRSYTPELTEASSWMAKFDRAFGHGISGGFAIGVPSRDDARTVVTKLRSADEGKPEQAHLFSEISTIDDLLPPDQPAKLAVLADLRRMIDSPAIRRLPHEQRARLLELRPPDDLGPLTVADVPAELAWPYTERDGTRGRLVLANSGLGIDTWRAHDLEAFARRVREMGLGQGVLVGGSAFVFSDMLSMMRVDGPRATLVALVASALVVLLFLGTGRHGRVALACAGFGTVSMLTAAWALDIKVNFLDFVALPITIGIVVDYAVNIAARARQLDGAGAGRRAMLSTGPVVALCSYTTIVGYASLLFSQNRGIHTFGLSAMIGELTCLSAALFFAPALLDLPETFGQTIASPPRAAAIRS